MDASSLDGTRALACARATVAAYAARDADQQLIQQRILTFVDAHADTLWRTCLAGHLTASALLLDDAREHVLLHHHKKLERWLQFGGHVDGDPDLARNARRETIEESGIAPAWISPDPIDLDVHPIPARPEEPAHDHHDVRFLAVAPPSAEECISEESNELRWFTPAAARALDLDVSLRRLIDLAFGR
ncbi:MAG: NUDIX hydrolase [bacterium]|nr:NUDIX hydrolase [bacterium]